MKSLEKLTDADIKYLSIKDIQKLHTAAIDKSAEIVKRINCSFLEIIKPIVNSVYSGSNVIYHVDITSGNILYINIDGKCVMNMSYNIEKDITSIELNEHSVCSTVLGMNNDKTVAVLKIYTALVTAPKLDKIISAFITAHKPAIVNMQCIIKMLERNIKESNVSDAKISINAQHHYVERILVKCPKYVRIKQYYHYNDSDHCLLSGKRTCAIQPDENTVFMSNVPLETIKNKHYEIKWVSVDSIRYMDGRKITA